MEFSTEWNSLGQSEAGAAAAEEAAALASDDRAAAAIRWPRRATCCNNLRL